MHILIVLWHSNKLKEILNIIKMENSVTLSLLDYEDLKEYERSFKEKKMISIFSPYNSTRLYESVSDNNFIEEVSKINLELKKENDLLYNENVRLNKIINKKWWKIW